MPGSIFTPFCYRQMSQKTVAGRRVKTPSIQKACTAMTTTANIIYTEPAERQLPTEQTRTKAAFTLIRVRVRVRVQVRVRVIKNTILHVFQ